MSTPKHPTDSVVLPVHCEDENCGMVSAYSFWPDGSHRQVYRACWHPKRFPSVEKIKQAIREEEAKTE